MRHLKAFDAQQQTVLMVQVENEVGIFGDRRDHSPEADHLFSGQVPESLLAYLRAHPDGFPLEISRAAKANARTWQQLPAPLERAGEYPSGGPHPANLEIYRAAAPALDFFSPDIYWPNFEHWLQRYRDRDNPLFVPEAKLDLQRLLCLR
jgi:hypothetical protein